MPEIADGLVEIAGVAREPGYRSKIAVVSHADGVDPVGACVGPRGSRVRMVVSELRGEKIDIIPYNDEPARFVAKALSPARVREVLVDDAAKQATVIVPDDQLSLAIGREGQNARLAARLTGWRVDIRSETEFAAEEAEHGYGEELEASGRCAAIMSNGRRCPNAVAARLALLRPRGPPGARQVAATASPIAPPTAATRSPRQVAAPGARSRAPRTRRGGAASAAGGIAAQARAPALVAVRGARRPRDPRAPSIDAQRDAGPRRLRLPRHAGRPRAGACAGAAAAASPRALRRPVPIDAQTVESVG